MLNIGLTGLFHTKTILKEGTNILRQWLRMGRVLKYKTKRYNMNIDKMVDKYGSKLGKVTSDVNQIHN